VLDRRHLLADRARAMLEEAGTGTGAGGGTDASFATRHIASSIRNTEALLAELDGPELAAAVDLLAGARRVVLIGLLSARPIADYAVYVANMSLRGWSAIAQGQAGLASELADLGPEDVAIVLSIEPYATRAVRLAQMVAARGVPLLALTDTRLSPVAAQAAHCFCIRTQSPQFFPSHVAATVFFEAIIGMVIHAKGSEAQQRIAATERQNHELGEYWQDKPATKKGD
jgi:DNA-binding MurR/RpiR family transcriptional regulator